MTQRCFDAFALVIPTVSAASIMAAGSIFANNSADKSPNNNQTKHIKAVMKTIAHTTKQIFKRAKTTVKSRVKRTSSTVSKQTNKH